MRDIICSKFETKKKAQPRASLNKQQSTAHIVVVLTVVSWIPRMTLVIVVSQAIVVFQAAALDSIFITTLLIVLLSVVLGRNFGPRAVKLVIAIVLMALVLIQLVALGLLLAMTTVILVPMVIVDFVFSVAAVNSIFILTLSIVA